MVQRYKAAFLSPPSVRPAVEWELTLLIQGRGFWGRVLSKPNITGYRFTLQWALALLLVSSMLILAACSNDAEPTPTVQATAAPTVEPAPTVQASPEPSSSPVPVAPAIAPALTPTPEPLTEDIPSCTPVPGSNVDPCEVGILGGPITNQADSYDFGTEPTSVRFHLGSDSSKGHFAAHLVARSTYLPGTLRCEATRIFTAEGGASSWVSVNSDAMWVCGPISTFLGPVRLLSRC